MIYRGFKIEKNVVNYYEAENLKDNEAPLLWAKTLEQIKIEVDEHHDN